MKFYVYVYRDPRPTKGNQPVYVGKGTGDRDRSHLWGSHNKPLQDFLSHLKRVELEPVFSRVFETDDETEAFAKEIELIAQYGRKNNKTGILFNLTDGGEGAGGAIKTDAHKEVDRNNSLENWKDPTYREKVIARQIEGNARPEVKARRVAASKEMWERVGDKIGAAIAVTRQTPESREKTRQQSRAQWADPEYQKKMRAIKAEIDTRPEVSEARSSKLKARWDDPAEREKRCAAMKVAAAGKYKPVHALPEGRTYESISALRAATGMTQSTASTLLKGGAVKWGRFKGWVLTYA